MAVRTRLPSQPVTCVLCGRVGEKDMRSGYGEREWLCIARKPCARRARRRKRWITWNGKRRCVPDFRRIKSAV